MQFKNIILHSGAGKSIYFSFWCLIVLLMKGMDLRLCVCASDLFWKTAHFLNLCTKLPLCQTKNCSERLFEKNLVCPQDRLL